MECGETGIPFESPDCLSVVHGLLGEEFPVLCLDIGRIVHERVRA